VQDDVGVEVDCQAPTAGGSPNAKRYTRIEAQLTRLGAAGALDFSLTAHLEQMEER
jgi:hypothetical protein